MYKVKIVNGKMVVHDRYEPDTRYGYINYLAEFEPDKKDMYKHMSYMRLEKEYEKICNLPSYVV